MRKNICKTKKKEMCFYPENIMSSNNSIRKKQTAHDKLQKLKLWKRKGTLKISINIWKVVQYY